MMDIRNEQYFYISGALSFLLFGIVLMLFASVLFIDTDVRQYALKKEDYIAVSLTVPSQKTSTNRAKPTDLTTPKPAETKPESSTKPVASSQTDISSLFSEVWTQKVDTKAKKVEKKLDTKRLAAIEKRIDTAEKREKAQASEKLNKLELVKPSLQLVGSASSSAAEVNEYFAKIQAFVYEHFFPPAGSEGSSAKVRIWLDASGKMDDFRVIAYSGHALFNSEVDRLKQRLKSVDFPGNPESRSIAIDIILIVQE
jgi:protein TonB